MLPSYAAGRALDHVVHPFGRSIQPYMRLSRLNSPSRYENGRGHRTDQPGEPLQPHWKGTLGTYWARSAGQRLSMTAFPLVGRRFVTVGLTGLESANGLGWTSIRGE
jgi:hypothetical protein